jgi:hypothetical protein
VVPVHGVVLEGTAIIDTSALTGEAQPVARGTGDQVASGTVHVGAAFRMCVVARASESTYTGIVRLIEAAQQSKAPAARLADRAASALPNGYRHGHRWLLLGAGRERRDGPCPPKRLQLVLAFGAGGCVWSPSSLASWHTCGARCRGKYACSRARERATGRTATSPLRRAATACWSDQVSIPQWCSKVTRAPSSEHG